MLIAAFGADARGSVHQSLIICSSDNNSIAAVACRKLRVRVQISCRDSHDSMLSSLVAMS